MDKRGEKKKMYKSVFVVVLAAMVSIICVSGAVQIGGEAGTEKVIIILNESMSFDEAKKEIDPILHISRSAPQDLEIIHGIAVEIPISLLRSEFIKSSPVIDKILPDREISLLPSPKPRVFQIK